MKANEIGTLFERIKKHFNTFGYDDGKVAEWHKFLKEYKAEDINNNFDKYILEYHDRPPLMTELIRNANKETELEEKPVVLQCEYCKEKELVYSTNDWLEKHRICQKIDFIDRQSKKIRGVGINKLKYYQMSSYELEKNYRKVMDNWLSTSKEIEPFKKL